MRRQRIKNKLYEIIRKLYYIIGEYTMKPGDLVRCRYTFNVMLVVEEMKNRKFLCCDGKVYDKFMLFKISEREI